MIKPEQKDFVLSEVTVLISKVYFILISITKTLKCNLIVIRLDKIYKIQSL